MIVQMLIQILVQKCVFQSPCDKELPDMKGINHRENLNNKGSSFATGEIIPHLPQSYNK